MNDSESTGGIAPPKMPTRSGHRVPALLVVGGGRAVLGRMFWVDQPLLLGRAGEADVWLDEEGVSRSHARIDPKNGGAQLVDLGSKNGTWVNGARVTEHQLEVGDLIQIGSSHILRFVMHDEFEEAAHRTLVQRATRDSLTGAYNRGSFYDQLRKDLSSAIRHREPLSVAMIDLDHFKRINDVHGHPVGDLALRHFARAVAPLIRSEDTFGRVGGEEFALLLRHCPVHEAARVTERIRFICSELDLMNGEQKVPLTVSIGVTCLPAGAAAADTQLMAVADHALYAAKQRGRNQVVTLPLE